MNTSRTLKGRRLGGAVYVLPNLITTGNLFFGFFSIVKSLQGDFRWAGAAILLATVFDVLDGRIARLTGGTSEFGVQYDSLCDLVSFGVAPAFLSYQFGLFEFGRIGWVFCFFFLACGALRLARFNVLSSIGKSSGDFTGLPIPMAAAVTATFVLLVTEARGNVEESAKVIGFVFEAVKSQKVAENFLVIACPVLAFLMVSNFSYRSHKVIKISTVKPFRLLVGGVFLAALVAYLPEFVGFLLCFLYALSGPFEWILGWKKPVDDDEIFTPHGFDESVMEPEESKHDIAGGLESLSTVRSHSNPPGKLN
jgi:CDP-diacylglycerol--serine O-phosphatidyltransferase